MPVKKVFQPVGVTFRGDGFYKTDSRGVARSRAARRVVEHVDRVELAPADSVRQHVRRRHEGRQLRSSSSAPRATATAELDLSSHRPSNASSRPDLKEFLHIWHDRRYRRDMKDFLQIGSAGVARETWAVTTGRRVVTDLDALRALAHPQRSAILKLLMSGRPRTATECAAVVGASPSACSYHLRSWSGSGSSSATTRPPATSRSTAGCVAGGRRRSGSRSGRGR